MKKRYVTAAAVLLISAVSLWGEMYSLTELLPAAVNADAESRRIAAGLEEARTRVNQAKSAYSPRVDVKAQAAYISELPEATLGPTTVTAGVHDTYATALEAQQLIFAGFARSAGIKNAENSLARGQFQAESRADSVRFSLVKAAYALSLADLSVDSLEASLARLELNRRKVNSFFLQGFSSELDLLEVDSAVTELQLKLRSMNADRESALILLRQISGKDDLEELKIDDSFLQLPDEQALRLKPSDLRENQAYQVTDYDLRALEIGRTVDKSGWYPSVSAFGSLNYGRPGANTFSDQWQFYYKGGIEVSFDLWDGGDRTNASKITQARIQGTEAARDKLLSDLQSRGEQTVEALTALQDQYKTTQELLAQKTRKYALVQELWQAGQKSTIDVLTAEQELTEADVSLKTIRIRLLSLYQDFLQLINQPVWYEGDRNE